MGWNNGKLQKSYFVAVIKEHQVKSAVALGKSEKKFITVWTKGSLLL